MLTPGIHRRLLSLHYISHGRQTLFKCCQTKYILFRGHLFQSKQFLHDTYEGSTLGMMFSPKRDFTNTCVLAVSGFPMAVTAGVGECCTSLLSFCSSCWSYRPGGLHSLPSPSPPHCMFFLMSSAQWHSAGAAPGDADWDNAAVFSGSQRRSYWQDLLKADLCVKVEPFTGRTHLLCRLQSGGAWLPSLLLLFLNQFCP